jgi:hypothetical protein
MHDLAKVLSNLRFDSVRLADLERRRDEVLNSSDRSLARRPQLDSDSYLRGLPR